jgi:hypothetical protein
MPPPSRAARKGLRVLVFSIVLAAACGVTVLASAVGLVWGQEVLTRLAEDATPPAVARVPDPPPEIGQPAPDFTLRDLDGKEVRLSDWRGRMPVVIEFANYTCPVSTGQVGPMDELARQFAGRAQFLVVYGNEEHPGDGPPFTTSLGRVCPLPQSRNRGDREAHARRFQAELQARRRILVDEDGAGSVQSRYGGTLHGVVVVDAQGRVRWSGSTMDGTALESVLGEDGGTGSTPSRAFAAP